MANRYAGGHSFCQRQHLPWRPQLRSEAPAIPMFAAMGVGAIAVLCGLFALIGLAVRRIAREAKHLGGPVTRLGIAALDRPGAATGRLAVSLGLGLTLLVTLAGTASSVLAEIETSIPKRAPALFLVDIPRAEEPQFRQMSRPGSPECRIAAGAFAARTQSRPSMAFGLLT